MNPDGINPHRPAHRRRRLPSDVPSSPSSLSPSPSQHNGQMKQLANPRSGKSRSIIIQSAHVNLFASGCGNIDGDEKKESKTFSAIIDYRPPRGPPSTNGDVRIEKRGLASSSRHSKMGRPPLCLQPQLNCLRRCASARCFLLCRVATSWLVFEKFGPSYSNLVHSLSFLSCNRRRNPLSISYTCLLPTNLHGWRDTMARVVGDNSPDGRDVATGPPCQIDIGLYCPIGPDTGVQGVPE